ncbi:hypothetical protein WUBG_07767, partial [Wuchereria bancrofti]
MQTISNIDMKSANQREISSSSSSSYSEQLSTFSLLSTAAAVSPSLNSSNRNT